MHPKGISLSRRHFLALTGIAVGNGFVPAFAEDTQTKSKKIPPSFTLFYKPEKTGNIWDTWIYYHQGTFYLYYNPKPGNPDALKPNMTKLWNGVALATSSDGVHWQEQGMVIDPVPNLYYLGAGAVWPAGEKYIMNFSERRQSPDGGMNQTIFFAESHDLMQWQRLDSKYAFSPDTRWYEPNGRWDNIWPIARSEGGYYGYFAGQPKNQQVGVGFGESDDGINWRALPPALLEEVPLAGPDTITGPTPEVAAAYYRKGKYYLLLGLNDLRPFSTQEVPVKSSITAMVSDLASGPFKPAPKNRQIMVSQSSYFLRFVEADGEILANHHSWEQDAFKPYETPDPERVWMAPLKRAEWDTEGTLRLKWWEKNNLAKRNSFEVSKGKSSRSSKPSLLETSFDPNETLILKGKINIPSSETAAPVGLYLQGVDNTGTAFLVRENGAVDYGSMYIDGTGFKKVTTADRELPLRNAVQFRLIRKGHLTEFYLNDYLMQCYSLPNQGSGRIGLIGPSNNFNKLKAWYCY